MFGMNTKFIAMDPDSGNCSDSDPIKNKSSDQDYVIFCLNI